MAQPSPIISTIARSAAVLAIATVHLYLYERTLVPIYASGPTRLYLKEILALSSALGISLSRRVSRPYKLLLAGLLLGIAPFETYWVAVLTARLHKPILGPSVVHLLVLAPIDTTLFTLISDTLVSSSATNAFASVLGFFAAYFLIASSSSLWKTPLSFISNPDNVILHTMAIVALLLAWTSWQLTPVSTQKQRTSRQKHHPKPKSSLSSSSLLTLGAILSLSLPLHRFLSSPILPHPLPSPHRKEGSPLLVHSAVESVTGLILVGEILRTSEEQGLDDEMHSVRFLRADHSLLGGVWTGIKVMALQGATEPVTDAAGEPLGDSIYATFNLQEAVLLGQGQEFKNGLIIGLGAGVSASAFMRHNISITIVEIDPAVYEAARTYFGLPDPGPGYVFLEDARGWVEQRQLANQEPFDFVIHDCFSGGGVPQHIFTVEFWEQLKSIVHPDGTVVVNTAGVLVSDSSRMIYHTLIKVFRQCRAFHDQFAELEEDQYETEFVNVVWFCTSSTKPLDFRKSQHADYLGSPLRRHVLQSLGTREIPIEVLDLPQAEAARFILTDASNPLGKLQEAQGPHHWEVMRQVMPDDIWEIF